MARTVRDIIKGYPIDYRGGSRQEFRDYAFLRNDFSPPNKRAKTFLFDELATEKFACINALKDVIGLIGKYKDEAKDANSRAMSAVRNMQQLRMEIDYLKRQVEKMGSGAKMTFGKKRSKSRGRSQSPVPDNVVNKALYRRARAKVKRRVTKWPSAYASGQVVMEYKRMGGKYRGRKKSFGFGSQKSKRKSRRRKSRNPGGLSRWFAEEWVDVCTGKPCGRKSARGSRRKYPYCRPKRRVTSRTPRTARSLTRAQKKSLCAKKRRSPGKRMKSLRKRKSSRRKSRRRKSR